MKGGQSIPEPEGLVRGLIGEEASGVVGFFRGVEERDDENVEPEESAGDTEDYEERGFHGVEIKRALGFEILTQLK